MGSRVAVYSLKGGTGKTTLTLALAGAAALRGLRVLVVDADPHPRAAGYLLDGQAGEPGRAVPGAGSWYGVRVMRWDGTGELPDGAAQLTLLDCPPDERNAAAAAAVADLALVPVQPERFALEGLAEVRAALPRDLPVSVVINLLSPREAEHRARVEEVRAALGGRVLEAMVPRRAAVPRAQGTGVPLQLAPTAGLGEVLAAVDDVLGHLLEQLGIEVEG